MDLPLCRVLLWMEIWHRTKHGGRCYHVSSVLFYEDSGKEFILVLGKSVLTHDWVDLSCYRFALDVRKLRIKFTMLIPETVYKHAWFTQHVLVMIPSYFSTLIFSLSSFFQLSFKAWLYFLINSLRFYLGKGEPTHENNWAFKILGHFLL